MIMKSNMNVMMIIMVMVDEEDVDWKNYEENYGNG